MIDDLIRFDDDEQRKSRTVGARRVYTDLFIYSGRRVVHRAEQSRAEHSRAEQTHFLLYHIELASSIISIVRVQDGRV